MNSKQIIFRKGFSPIFGVCTLYDKRSYILTKICIEQQFTLLAHFKYMINYVRYMFNEYNKMFAT